MGSFLKKHFPEAAVLVVCAVTTAWLLRCGSEDRAQIAMFVVTSITLAVLIIYARDTNRMARVASERWERESRPRGRYSMDAQEAFSNRVPFSLINPSDLILRAKVWCNFKVYGTRVIGDDGFEGKRVWPLFPEQVSSTWFEIEPLLSKVGKSINVMRSETTDANRKTQLTMILEMEFRDELGSIYRPPARPHFYDFSVGIWVPEITSPDSEW